MRMNVLKGRAEEFAKIKLCVLSGLARNFYLHELEIGETSTDTLITCSPPPRATPLTGVTSE